MALVTPDRFNTLKAKVKAEYQQRKYIQGENGVANFADADYDYNIIPTSGKVIHQRHKNKLIDNDDLITMETNIIIYENTAIDNINKSNCGAACTGLCYNTCGTGCSTTCIGTCTGSCTGTCKTGCTGCSGSCKTGCGSGCQVNCVSLGI